MENKFSFELNFVHDNSIYFLRTRLVVSPKLLFQNFGSDEFFILNKSLYMHVYECVFN